MSNNLLILKISCRKIMILEYSKRFSIFFPKKKIFWNFFLVKNSTFKKIIQLVLKLSRCYGDCDELNFLYFWLNLRYLCLYNFFCWWWCLPRFVACSNIKMGIVALLGPHPFCAFSLPHSPINSFLSFIIA